MLRRLSKFTALLEDSLLVLMLTAMILIAATQIVMRNFWDSGLAWGDPLTRVLVLWVGVLGAMVATRKNHHINIDILSRFLPEAWQRWSHVITQLFTAVVCALLAYHGARLTWMDWESGTLAFGDVPTWVCELVIPLGFGIIALRNLLAAMLGMLRRTLVSS